MKTLNIFVLLISIIGSIGCSKQIDRLLGHEDMSRAEHQARYPWLYPKPGYSKEFCDRYPSLDVCGGDQTGFRNKEGGSN